MTSTFFKFLQDIRGSYWFIPSLMVAFALLLASWTQRLDLTVSPEMISGIPYVSLAQPDGARAILTTIAGSIISVAGVTFSITIATVSFASGNFGPRLISNFMRDRGVQLTLGVFIATFVYGLVILRTVQSGDDQLEAFVPFVSLIAAQLLAVTSVGFFIFFCHHVPELINIQNLTATVGREMVEQIEDLFPNDYDGGCREEASLARFEAGCVGKTRHKVSAGRSGYIRSFSISEAKRIAESHSLIIDLQYRPGNFIISEDIAMEVWLLEGEKLDQGVEAKLRNLFATGKQRTFEQDLFFRIDILTEIAGRALSPGINDPQTAITCFNWIRSATYAMAKRDLVGAEDDGEIGKPPLIRIAPISFEHFIYRAYTRARPYVASDRNASFHIVHVLAECAADLPEGERRDTLVEELEATVAEAAALNPDAIWTKDLQERLHLSRRALRSAEARDTLKRTPNWFGGSA